MIYSTQKLIAEQVRDAARYADEGNWLAVQWRLREALKLVDRKAQRQRGGGPVQTGANGRQSRKSRDRTLNLAISQTQMILK